MNFLATINTPMQSVLWSKNNTFLKQFLLVSLGVLVLALASQLSVPLKPVPLTFQSATVVLIGMLYGPRYGTYVVAAYLLAGLCGLPVFEGLAYGTSKFFGPTCGYLIGFLPAAFISGYLGQNGWAKNAYTSFLALSISISVIFLFGVVMLAQGIGWHNAVTFGLMPFLIAEPIKLIAASVLVPKFWKKS